MDKVFENLTEEEAMEIIDDMRASFASYDENQITTAKLQFETCILHAANILAARGEFKKANEALRCYTEFRRMGVSDAWTVIGLSEAAFYDGMVVASLRQTPSQVG